MALMNDTIILVTEHDAYGFTVVTNHTDLQDESSLRAFLEERIME